MAMPNFRVEATMGPISPDEEEHNIGLLKVSAPANTSAYKYCVRACEEQVCGKDLKRQPADGLGMRLQRLNYEGGEPCCA